MHADIGERERRTHLTRIQHPVAWVDGEQLLGQPRPVDRVHAPELVADHELAQRLDHRVVAIRVAHRMHDIRALGEAQQLGGVAGCRGERLLGDDVLAGFQGGAAVRQVQRVGGADVDHVDIVGGDELLGRAVDARDSESLSIAPGDGGRCRGDAGDRHAQAS